MENFSLLLAFLSVGSLAAPPLALLSAESTRDAKQVGRLLQQQPCASDEDPLSCKADLANCASKDITGCQVDCVDDRACESSTLKDSSVECQQTRSCFGSKHHRNTVTCAEPQSTCPSSQFFASSLSCESLLSCQFSAMYSCSCCTNSANCPSNVPLCNEDFCSTLYLGQSCKAWGNPACSNIGVDEDPAPLHPASTCTLNQDVVACYEGNTSCNGVTIQGCSLDCFDSTCSNSDIFDSTVECVSARACQSSFTRSTISCSDPFGTCSASTFTASAVQCRGVSSCYASSFEGSCNCCDGPGCPADQLSCVVNRKKLCSETLSTEGITCEEAGNPVCQTTPTSAPTFSSMDNPTTSASSVPSDEPSSGASSGQANISTVSFFAIVVTLVFSRRDV